MTIHRHSPQRANVITHIHTEASNAEASELDRRIARAILETDGVDSPITWSECFTPVQHLVELLKQGRGGRGPLQMIVVTDHMRARSHRFPSGHLAAAAAEPRLALGAELATRTLDMDGRYHKGPEILAYGSPEVVDGPHGPYFGLGEALLEELYRDCLDPDGEELCTRKASRLLRRRGIAHGVSHPFDGHHLSLEGTFAIISEFDFVETVNGGYFAPSVRVLDAFVRFNNAILRGACLADEHQSPLTRRLISHIRRHGRLTCPWGGSDAHFRDFDRVVVSMAARHGQAPSRLLPGDLFQAMLDWQTGADPRQHPAAAPPLFANVGRPATQLSLLADILGIISRNVGVNRRRFCQAPRVFAEIMRRTHVVTSDELRIRRSQQQKRRQELHSQQGFNPMTLLPLLQLPSVARPRRLRSVA